MIILVLAFSMASCGDNKSSNVVDDLERDMDNSAVMDTGRGNAYTNKDSMLNTPTDKANDGNLDRLEANRDHNGINGMDYSTVGDDGFVGNGDSIGGSGIEGR